LNLLIYQKAFIKTINYAQAVSFSLLASILLRESSSSLPTGRYWAISRSSASDSSNKLCFDFSAAYIWSV